MPAGQTVSRFLIIRKRADAKRSQRNAELHKCGVYVIENTENLHRYVGQSVDIYERWNSHKRALRCGKHTNQYLQNAWNLYGEKKFIFNVLEFCRQDELDFRETFWMERLSPEYNISKNPFVTQLEYIHEDKSKYFKIESETFIRPKWHLWVYGGYRREDAENMQI